MEKRDALDKARVAMGQRAETLAYRTGDLKTHQEQVFARDAAVSEAGLALSGVAKRYEAAHALFAGPRSQLGAEAPPCPGCTGGSTVSPRPGGRVLPAQ